MSHERPPETEAEYRVVHGPWPRWTMHLSLVKVALFTAAVVAGCVVTSLLVLLALRALA